MAAGKRFFSIRRLRWAMLVGGLTVLVVVSGYIGYARYRMNRFVAGLPGKLGINITQETDHVTYSQTWQGRTVFTLRAAKQIQHKDGTFTLKDVGVVVYGRTGNRQDRIHGNEFEYDQKNGIMRAVGDVYIDLAPPPNENHPAGPAEDDSRLIHVKTSGLVFEQKEQQASTDHALEFRSGAMSGTAVGAFYDSGTGVLVLRSDVHLSGFRGKYGGDAEGRPLAVTAGHAVMEREGNVVRLDEARVVTASDHGSQTATASHAVVRMAADGSPQRVDANGNVVLTQEGQGKITAERLETEFGAGGQATAAHLAGAVRYANEVDNKAASGKANDARIAFDAQGRPTHATMTGAVQAAMLVGAGSRSMSGDKVELALAGGGKQPVVLRGATATAADGARMRIVNPSSRKDAKGKVTNGVETTNVKGDMLTARFVERGPRTQVSGVDGSGRTSVERNWVEAAGGVQQWKETGTGEVLKVDFRQGAKDKAELLRAEQRGGVKIVREAVATKKGAAPDVEHAEGDVAVYEADQDRMTMTGQVRVSTADSALFADRVQMNRTNGDATAEGSVRVNYLQPGSTGEPVHVIAARALGHKDTGITDFLAAPSGNVRMWQGGSSVEAPVLEFDRNKKTVVAHGIGAGQAVKTILVEEKNAKAGPPPTAKDDKVIGSAGKRAGGTVRVLSREMVYSDASREVEFKGAVQVNDQDGVMRAQTATIYLVPKSLPPTSRGESARDGTPGELGLGGKVDHMVVAGVVELEQPGRKGSGDKLVYTADDRTFVLTGTKSVPPKVVDEAQGTVTGATLRFRNGDDSVEVLSGDGAQKVRTETRMKQKN